MPEREDTFLNLVRENEGRLRKICRVYADTGADRRDLRPRRAELTRLLQQIDDEMEGDVRSD